MEQPTGSKYFVVDETVDQLSGCPHFERLSITSREAAHLQPLAMEALLNLRIGMVCDERRGATLVRPNEFLLRPALMRQPEVSPYSSFVAFTRWEYFVAARPYFSEQLETGLALGASTSEIIKSTKSWISGEAEDPRLLVIDPFTPHALRVDLKDAYECRLAWDTAPHGYDPFEMTSETWNVTAPCHPISVGLVDGVRELMTCLPQVEQAYLAWMQPANGRLPPKMALMVRCGGWMVMERIHKAMRLLSCGVPPSEALHYIVSVTHHAGLLGKIESMLHPVYSRSVAMPTPDARLPAYSDESSPILH